jgi:hypothetical protein
VVGSDPFYFVLGSEENSYALVKFFGPDVQNIGVAVGCGSSRLFNKEGPDF